MATAPTPSRRPLHRHPAVWLVAAAVLFGLSAWLMSAGDEVPEPEKKAEVNFPRRMREEERQRMVKRRVALPQPAAAPEEPAAPSRPLVEDPVLRALGGAESRSAMIVEANAIRHSPIGELLLACVRNRARRDPVERLREEAGVDPLEQVDRVAVSDDALVVTGHFKDAKWDGMLDRFHRTSYGDKARIYSRQSENLVAGETRDDVLAVWNDELVVVADSEEEARKVIDRIEGREAVKEPLIPEQATYGELYGVLAAEDVARMFEEQQPELAARLREVASSVELHIDTRSDVGIVADVKGSDRDKVADLAKSMGAALSVARLQAQAEGQKVAEFLDLARVRPQGDQFTLELALPMPLLEKHLAFCRAPRGEDPAPEAPAAGAKEGEL